MVASAADAEAVVDVDPHTVLPFSSKNKRAGFGLSACTMHFNRDE